MKYLKQFESVDELKIIRDYICMCFVDFIDDGEEYFTDSDINEEDICLFEMFIEIPKLDFHSYKGDFDTLKVQMFDNMNKYTEIIERIEENINKVRIQYDDFNYKLTPESEDFLHLEITRNK